MITKITILIKVGQKIYDYLDKYFSKNEKEIIKNMELTINQLKESLKKEKDNVNIVHNTNIRLNNELNDLKENNLKNQKPKIKDKHENVHTYMSWLKQNVNSIVKYHYTQHGKVRPHQELQRTKDYNKILDFARSILPLEYFKNEDDLVYKFNLNFHLKYPTKTWYQFDKVTWGKQEYWETAEEVINLIHDKKTFGDCDSVSILKYWCLRLMLDKYFPNWNKRRLAMFILKLNITGEGHAILGWVKDGPNDWIPIESTYFNDNFYQVWNNNYRLRHNTIAYKILYSFDTDGEYVKI